MENVRKKIISKINYFDVKLHAMKYFSSSRSVTRKCTYFSIFNSYNLDVKFPE